MTTETYLVVKNMNRMLVEAYGPQHAVEAYARRSDEGSIGGHAVFQVYPVAHDASWNRKEVLWKDVVDARPDDVEALADETGVPETELVAAINGNARLPEASEDAVERAAGRPIEELTLSLEYE